MNKTILVVGGSERQVPIVKKCKELNHYVINVDANKDSPGFEYADANEVVNILDLEECLKVAQKYSVDGVISEQSDIAVPTVAYVSEKMGLPTIGYETSLLFTNKFKMRQFCKENNFHYPKFYLCSSFEEINEKSKELEYPFIIKPIDNSASRGVNIVRCEKELIDKYADTINFSRTNQVLIEEYINGIELTVEGFKTKSKHFSLAVSEKEHYKNAQMVANKLFYSPSNDYIDYEELKIINNKLVESMGLPFGITHAEYKYLNGKFYLIEIAARGGGARIASEIVPLITNIDTYKLLIDYVLGESGEIDNFDTDLYVCLEFFDLQTGKIKNIQGYNNIKKMNEVIYCQLDYNNGDIVKVPYNDGLRAGYYIAYEKSRESLDMLSKKIRDMLVVTYE
jgi:Biotin carboxylase